MHRTPLLLGLGRRGRAHRLEAGGSCRAARKLRHGGLFLAAALLLSGCSTAGFYAQAIGGQLELARKARPAGLVAADPATPTELRRKLALVSELREFARDELALETGRSYTRYADLGREYVVWSVFATPEFSLEPKTWRFPVIGELGYRGYFSEKAAERYAARLRARGYDAYVGGVGAYSTLGFFADPVLNTFLEGSDTSVAEYLFHELAHRRLYRPGETAFNESFANAVAQEGVRRWLRAHRGDREAARYEKRLGRRAELLAAIATARADLAALYTDNPTRKAKKARFAELRSRIRTLFEAWGSTAPEAFVRGFDNNARLAATATYHDHVPFFTYLLQENGHDFARFYEAAEALSPGALPTP